MGSNANCLNIVRKRVGGELTSLGFHKEGTQAFRKDVGDLRWYISLSSHPKGEPGITDIFAHACAFSEPLEEKLRRLPPPWTWASSQVRATFQRLAKIPIDRYKTDAWHCSSDADANQAAEEIVRLLYAHALPFLEEIKSTDDLVAVMRRGIYSIASMKRLKYDADVWEGLIDPEVTPFGDFSGPYQVSFEEVRRKRLERERDAKGQ